MRRTSGAIFRSQAKRAASRAFRVATPQTSRSESNGPLSSGKRRCARNDSRPPSPATFKSREFVASSTVYTSLPARRFAAPKTCIGPTRSSSSTGGTTTTATRRRLKKPLRGITGCEVRDIALPTMPRRLWIGQERGSDLAQNDWDLSESYLCNWLSWPIWAI